jgi:uncharacterized membrane protein YfcA
MASALDRVELLPISLVVAFLANASGFSGGVLFQPIIFFTQGLPLASSIATGIASETLGMSSGAWRYHLQRQVPWREVLPGLPWVALGVTLGAPVLLFAPVKVLQGVLGGVLVAVAALKVWELRRPPVPRDVPAGPLARAAVGLLGGLGSASTGTGVCELHQPWFERLRARPLREANASAVATEAFANLLISSVNLVVGNIDPTVLVWTGPGCIVGAQLGARFAHLLPERALKAAFAVSVLGIGAFYLWRAQP